MQNYYDLRITEEQRNQIIESLMFKYNMVENPTEQVRKLAETAKFFKELVPLSPSDFYKAIP